jgi:hypothetical protein
MFFEMGMADTHLHLSMPQCNRAQLDVLLEKLP